MEKEKKENPLRLEKENQREEKAQDLMWKSPRSGPSL